MRSQPVLLFLALGFTAGASHLPAPARAAQGKPSPKARPTQLRFSKTPPAARARTPRGGGPQLLRSNSATTRSPAQAPAPAATPRAGEEAVDPRSIWPAGLERIAGRYRFVQVASPGGLWMSSGGERRQVSLHELSPVMRERLSSAEIVISDLKLPTAVEASQRQSPSKRGMLRYYTETAAGKLVMKNLPGIGGEQDDPGSHEGPVMFELSHSSHSNPSVAGVLAQRLQQEPTWGAATLDYADLQATRLKPDGAEEDQDAPPVLGNARILRSGVEIFAFVNWTERSDDGAEKQYTGSVRLARQSEAPRQ